MRPPHFSPMKENASGSSNRDEPAFLAVGRLRRPHGLKGDLLMEVLTDFPERFETGMVLYLGDQHKPVRLDAIRDHDRLLIVSLAGFSTPEEAGALRNQVVYVPGENRPPLEEGEYYHHQLLGLQVEDESGRLLGTVRQILETGANDVFVVQPERGREILLPATDEVLLEVDLEKAVMRVHLLPGLVEGWDDEESR
jgi:16S rRNA processing protein RimM